jgi:collagenase-like PrtC family protease
MYGCIPCVWQGGRFLTEKPDWNWLEEQIKVINENNISIFVNMSAYNIYENELDDKDGNRLLEMLSNSNINGIIISNDMFSKYAYKTYPKLKQKVSILKSTYEHPKIDSRTANYYNDLLDRFDEICINTNDCRNIGMLKGIKDKSRLEVLINQGCIRNCPYAVKHYEIHSTNQKEYCNKRTDPKILKKNYDFICPATNNILKLSMKDFEIKKLGQIGITKLKLAGRDKNELSLMLQQILKNIKV